VTPNSLSNPLSDDYVAGYAEGKRDGWEEGWKSGWLQRGAELVAIVTASGDYTPTQRAGVMRAYQEQVARMEGAGE